MRVRIIDMVVEVDDVDSLDDRWKQALQRIERRGVTLSRDQLESWAGRTLTDDEIDRLDDCIPNSSIPEAVGTIAEQFAS